MSVAIVKRPLEEPHCGDQAGTWQKDGKTILCIVDGLGHGRGAERAARAALDFVGRHHHEPLLDLFAGCDRALRPTRGVAMGVARVDPAGGALTYAGIGNTRARVVGRETVRLTSQFGIVGGGYRALTPATVPLAPGDLVILSTDGIQEPIDLSPYEEAVRADVGRLARAVLEDRRRDTDDAAVLIFRNGR